MHPALFLGLGKVNKSLAAVIAGEKKALVEDEDSDEVIEYLFEGEDWRETTRHLGSFDNLNFKKFLPAAVFVSPGIDPRREFFQEISSSEVRELDYFCRNFKGKIVGVTGTDGKSTFTTHLGELLKRALPQKKIFVGGNLGTAMADALKGTFEIAVLELSSFQTERLKSAKLHLAVLLNLAKDHMDRYDRLEDYFDAKWALLDRAEAVFFPKNCAPTRSGVVKKQQGNYLNGAELSSILKPVMDYLSREWNFRWQITWLKDLKPLRHRLERYKDSRGVVFVNDSKATTVHATRYAMRVLRPDFPKIHLIVGGHYKGDDFQNLKPDWREADKILVCGEAQSVISEQLRSVELSFESYPDLKTLMQKLPAQLKAGDCLLLSPGCSSYDEFNNFEERGDKFLEWAGRPS